MKSRMRNFYIKLSILVILVIASLSFAACTPTTQESPTDKIENQQADIFIPVVESNVAEKVETGSDQEAYPDKEQTTQNQEIIELSQDAAYPEPETDIDSKLETVEPQEEADPAPQEEPVQEIKPTPRGNELVATNPSTVNLASGQLQFVELFAFW